MLNILKVMWDSTSIYTHWALNSKKLFQKIPTYMWSMCKLIMNYELIKNELKVNYELIGNELGFN